MHSNMAMDIHMAEEDTAIRTAAVVTVTVIHHIRTTITTI